MKPKKMQLRKGDTVLVIAGKEISKKGKILRVLPEAGRIVIEGLNMVRKHQKPTQRQQRGGIIEMEAPLHVSNVMLICGKCSKATRIGHTTLGDGRKVRVCRKCGEVIDK